MHDARRIQQLCHRIKMAEWQTGGIGIMIQPSAMSGAVEKPNSSAPSSAATTTSRPCFSRPWPRPCGRQRAACRPGSPAWSARRSSRHWTSWQGPRRPRMGRCFRRRSRAAVARRVGRPLQLLLLLRRCRHRGCLACGTGGRKWSIATTMV